MLHSHPLYQLPLIGIRSSKDGPGKGVHSHSTVDPQNLSARIFRLYCKSEFPDLLAQARKNSALHEPHLEPCLIHAVLILPASEPSCPMRSWELVFAFGQRAGGPCVLATFPWSHCTEIKVEEYSILIYCKQLFHREPDRCSSISHFQSLAFPDAAGGTHQWGYKRLTETLAQEQSRLDTEVAFGPLFTLGLLALKHCNQWNVNFLVFILQAWCITAVLRSWKICSWCATTSKLGHPLTPLPTVLLKWSL